MLSILRRTKKFLPIGKITAYFAHRFFSIQEMFAHYSKNLGCATGYDKYVIMLNWLNHFYVESKLDVFTFVDFQTLTLYIITKLKGFISIKTISSQCSFCSTERKYSCNIRNSTLFNIAHDHSVLFIHRTHLSYCLLYLEDKEENYFRFYNLLSLCSV